MTRTAKTISETVAKTAADAAESAGGFASNAASNAGEFASTTASAAGEFAQQAVDKIGSFFGTDSDAFTDRLVAKAKSFDAKDFVPTRKTVTRAGAGAGLLLAGAAAIAAGAFAFYYFKELNQEEADFDLLAKEGDFELRRYKPLLVAETVQTGGRKDALDAGFTPLANYIFAKPGGRAEGEDDGEKIAMTVPVTAASADHDSWRIRFTMPASYSRKALPEPAAGVSIVRQKTRHIAAVRFSGRATEDDLVEEKRHELIAWLTERGFTPVGDPEYAYYNAPIVLGALRRNEVWIEIEAP